MLDQKRLKMFRLTAELLQIIDNAGEFSRGDLQGALEAWVLMNCKLDLDRETLEKFHLIN